MRLSIVVGTYNRLDLLKRCIDSIFAQTQTPFHLYVSDAGSTDGTIDYLKSIASDQLIPIFEGQKIGQARAYNAVFEKVETPYTCWLSDDNVVVDRGLDIAVEILDKHPSFGMIALKTTDLQGPFEAAPYIGGVSQIGILNVNQGMLRTNVLKQVGGFSEYFRDYGIDPDLTAKVLFSGYDIAYTRQIALHHYRDWGEDAALKAMQEKQKIYQKRYFNKYAALAKDNLGWKCKRLFWRILRRGLGLQRYLDSSRPIFNGVMRDWHNIFTGRYISLLDPVRYHKHPFHLVQHCPRPQLPAKLPSDPIMEESAPKSNPDIWPWIKEIASIKTIIDIGANNGDFAEFLANYFKADRTYVFEPLPIYTQELEQKKRSIQNLTIFNVALSDTAGEETFFQNSYGPASSFLKVSDQSKAEFPQTAGESAIQVKVARLDDLLATETLDGDILIKIDVQGFEDKVIRGGRHIFAKARYVLIEMSFVPMYIGQPLFNQVHAQLAELGYEFSGVKNQISAASGQPMFAHCLYIKEA